MRINNNKKELVVIGVCLFKDSETSSEVSNKHLRTPLDGQFPLLVRHFILI